MDRARLMSYDDGYQNYDPIRRVAPTGAASAAGCSAR